MGNVDRLDSVPPTWRLHLNLSTNRPLLRETFFAHSSLTRDIRIPVTFAGSDEHEVTIDLPRLPMRVGDDDIAVLLYAGQTPSLLDRVGASIYLRFDGQTLVPIDFETYLERADRPDEILPSGHRPPPTELAKVAPWDNPELLPEDRELAARLKSRLESNEPLGSREAALTASTEPVPSTGCEGGTSTGIVLGAVALLLMALRKRGFAGSMLVLLLVSAPKAEAKIAYGYVSFWDTRDAKSNLAGSRLRWCDTSNTTCGVTDGEACCFRPLPHATIEVRQDGLIIASAELNANGFFIVSFSGNDSTSYSFYLSYERAGDPGATRLVTTTPVTTAPPYKKLLWKNGLAGTDFAYLGEFRQNTAGDTSSVDGHRATAWTTVTTTQELIAIEGDTRYRRVFGASPTAPDDPIVMHHGSKHGIHCSGSYMRFGDSTSRNLAPASAMGSLYHGRVVGCDTASYGTPLQNLPAYPMNPGYIDKGTFATAESVALHMAIPEMIAWLSRWNPRVAALSHLKAVLSVGCQADNLDNSNQAARFRNAAFGLWEWIDVDTSGSDGLPDTCSIKLKHLMDGLLAVSTVAGPTFTPLTPAKTCNAVNGNEDCDPGHACVDLRDGNLQCAGGDPHNGNLGNLAVQLFIEAYNHSWPGAGSFFETLNSSPCIDPADNTYEFTGGYKYH